MDDKVNSKVVLSILKFLRKELKSGELTEGAVESIEVAIQCLESAYGTDSNMEEGHIVPDLVELFCASDVWTEPSSDSFLLLDVPEEVKAEAEDFKNVGNTLMKEENYAEAVKKYTNAISLDSSNAVYFCNRAAAQSKLGNHAAAIEDCKRALQLDPSYSKAYGRLGIAYSSLNQHEAARNSYLKALELEPDNESYKNNLSLTNEQIGQRGERSDATMAGGSGRGSPPFDLSMLINNPTLMSMATQMLSNPNMQNMMSGLMSAGTGDTSMEALLLAGQQLAQQMQNINPEFVDSLRRQMGEPDGSNAAQTPPDQTDGNEGPNNPQQ